MSVSYCPLPNCNGVIIRNQCNRCGAWSYIGRNEGLRTAGGREIPDPPTRRAPAVPYRPLRVMTCEQWKLLTWTRWNPRSIKLKAIDRALEGYETDKGQGAFLRVEGAFSDWVSAKGGMEGAKHSIRNKKGAVEYLAAQLAGEKVRIPGDLPEFMEAGMENARLGVLYLFQNIRVKPDIFSMVLQGGLTVVGGALQCADAVPNSGDLSNLESVKVTGEQLLRSNPLRVPPNTSASDVGKINSALTNVTHKLVAGTGELFSGIDVGDVAATVVNTLKGLVKTLANLFLEQAAPFISGGMEIVGGLTRVTEAVVDLVKTWYRGRGVNLMQGHPTVIASSLKWSMARSLFTGIYETLKGVAGTIMDAVGTFVTAGTATAVMKVVTIIYGILETIAKLAFKLFETLLMDKFCRTAKEFWAQKDQPDAFHKSPTQFNRWYKKWAMPFPALAALTLNSGWCGDKMRFLRMFKDDDQIISQDQFDQGVMYIDGQLKPYASKYLEEAGYGFRSEDPTISAMIKRESVWRPTTTGGKVSKFLLKVLKN